MNALSGLKGIINGDSVMRSILDRASKGDSNAALAIDMFVYILATHIAARSVLLFYHHGNHHLGIDAIVLTAGI